MRMDEVDILILSLLSKNKKLTTSMLAKQIFQPKNNHELTNVNSVIYYRLHKLLEYRLVKETERKNGKKYYFLDFKNIILGKGFVYVKPVGVKRGRRIFLNKLFVFMDNKICHTFGF